MRPFLLLALLATTACAASTSAGLTDALAPARALGTAVTCTSPCATEWQRAQVWLVQHSIAKVRAATDVRLETEPATTVTGFDAMYAFLVLREPVDSARYQITMRPTCKGGMRGCSPKEADVVAAFLYYVTTGNDVLVGRDDGALRRVAQSP
jgi:hypothetical protein